MNRALSSRGVWPDRVTLRSGWWQATARPVNDDVADATIRLERGSSEFLRRCCQWLFDRGIPGVHSVPLHPGARRVWDEAGFDPYRRLLLFERDLSFDIAAPETPPEPGADADWPGALEIDRAAFAADWRIGALGLEDARTATPASAFTVIREGDRPVGFAITGLAHSTAYLQRIAVHPDAQGRGLGRSLLRDALGWARRHGARTILLNTQLDNHGAARLYRAERFESLPQHLVLLRSTP